MSMMTDADPSSLFGLADVDDATLASFIPQGPASGSSSGASARVDIKSSPSDELDLSSEDVSQSFFNSSAWDFQGTPPYDTYDGASTAVPPQQPTYLASSWPPLPDFNQSPLNSLGSPSVDPASLFAPPAPLPTPNPRADRVTRNPTVNVPRAMTTLTPAVQEHLRNIAMPPHLQYHSPKSASSPDSATEGKNGVRSSSDSGDASKSRKRKSLADDDDDEEEDEDGKPVKKTSHNMIEKRYRTNLNDKIAALRDSVPSLRIMSKSARGEDTTNDREELHGLTPAHKLNKATVLSKATEYIRHLEKRNGRLMDQNSAMQARIAAFEKLFMAGAMNGSISPMQQQQPPPTPMQYSMDNGQQQYSNSPHTSPGEGEPSAAGMIQVPDDMKRILSAQMAIGQPYAVPQQHFRGGNPTFLRQQQIQQQSQTQQSGWGNAAPYFGKLMVGSLAGLMILEAVREDEVSNEKPEGRGLFAVPVHMLSYLASGLDLNLMGMHVHNSLKVLLFLGTFLWVFVPSLFAPIKSKPDKAPIGTLQPAPSLASSIQVRRQAWLTSIQTVWVPRHNFFLEAAALIAKTAKLSMRNAIGAHAYQMLTGVSEEQESGRVKAWTIALDSQLAGGDVEINKSRLTLTLLASGTLPDTPSRLMLKALHIRVLLLDVSSNRLHLGAVNAVAAKLARANWNQARQLNQMLAQLRRGSAEQHEDELPEHLAVLLEQKCDDVFTNDVIQRAYNLAFGLETTHNVEAKIDGMDAVVCDTAVGSPMDAVAAWWSTQTLHRVLEATLNKDEEALETKTQDLDLALQVAPNGSVAQARAAVARAALLDEGRGKNIALAMQTLDSLGTDAMNISMPATKRGITACELDLRLSLRCATSVAHLLRAAKPSDVPAQETRLIDTVLTPATVSSMSLLRCAAAMELMETYFANKGAADLFGSSLERLAGSLRLWMGDPAGNACGVGAEVRHSVVDRCLTITKSLVGMEMDTGYGSLSEGEDES